MAIEKAFAVALKQARSRSGFSQEQLALLSGLDRTYVSLLERGLRQPSLKTIFALSESLSLEPKNLISTVSEVLNENH